MAIYGIGAFYGEDVSKDFISQEKACIGWEIGEAPALHKIIKQIKVGDLIYIKSFTPNTGLRIKSIGIITDDTITSEKLETCLKVKWICHETINIGRNKEKYNVRNNTIYEEYNPDIQKIIIEQIVDKLK